MSVRRFLGMALDGVLVFLAWIVVATTVALATKGLGLERVLLLLPPLHMVGPAAAIGLFLWAWTDRTPRSPGRRLAGR